MEDVAHAMFRLQNSVDRPQDTAAAVPGDAVSKGESALGPYKGPTVDALIPRINDIAMQLSGPLLRD